MGHYKGSKLGTCKPYGSLPKIAEAQLLDRLAFFCKLCREFKLDFVKESIGNNASSSFIRDNNVACKQFERTVRASGLSVHLRAFQLTVTQSYPVLTVAIFRQEAEDMAVHCVREASSIC